MTLNIPVNAPQQQTQKHCQIKPILPLPSFEKWLSLLIISCRMRPRIPFVHLARLMTSWRAFLCCPRSLHRPFVLLLTCSNKIQHLIYLDTIPGSRYETLVLCCGSAWNKPGSPCSEFDRCSCLRGGFSLEMLICVKANVCTANLLE